MPAPALLDATPLASAHATRGIGAAVRGILEGFSALAADLWSQKLWSVEDQGPFIAAFAKNVMFADDLTTRSTRNNSNLEL